MKSGLGVRKISGVVVGSGWSVDVSGSVNVDVDVARGAALGMNVGPRQAGTESTRTAGWSVLPN